MFIGKQGGWPLVGDVWHCLHATQTLKGMEQKEIKRFGIDKANTCSLKKNWINIHIYVGLLKYLNHNIFHR